MPSEPRAPLDRLDSWKEIAAFLGRGVRTVQRWEREEGLPVHRLPHAKRGSVFAYRQELSRWWESRRLTLVDATAKPRDHRHDDEPRISRPLLIPAAMVCLTVAVGALVVVLARQPVRAEPKLQRVTATAGATFWPALSPDGRTVAYASDGGQDGTQLQIWTQPIGGAPLRVTDCRQPCGEPSFTADGESIGYTVWTETGRSIYQVPARGGTPRLLRANAHGARWSPDGKWVAFISVEHAEPRLRIASVDGATVRAPADSLLGIDFAAWAPDSSRVIVRARQQPESEPDWWTVTPDGATHDTHILRALSSRGFAGRWQTELAPAWIDRGSLVFSDGVALWRQRIDSSTCEPRGEPDQLTRGAAMAWFAAAGGGRVAFVSSNPDVNLRSIATDPESGVAYGPLLRMTRGAGVVQYPSLASDGRTLAYSTSRSGNGDVIIRDLQSGTERVLVASPAHEAYSAISPSGRQVAYGTVMPGDRVTRPVSVVDTHDATVRSLCDDCGGRPRAWIDERRLVLEKPAAPLASLFVLDTVAQTATPLLESQARSVSNPRVSRDGSWIAFDARDVPGRTSVFVAPLRSQRPIPESSWVQVATDATHPFWSFHGNVLYFLTGPSVVSARRLDAMSNTPKEDSFTVFTSPELTFPSWLPGTTPVATANQIVFVLADIRGDVWVMDIAPRR